VYRIETTEVHATLYSIGDFDVASIATELGGGGHKNAAGFTVDFERWFNEFLC
jgi:nanoRNase/pAp phosphatase (c-di-AMP/oligoRNAs hydrolase)